MKKMIALPIIALASTAIIFVLIGLTKTATEGEASQSEIALVPTFTSTPNSVPSTPAHTSTPTPVPMVFVDHKINLRAGPSTNYHIMGTADQGDQFRITGKNPGLGDWWEIERSSNSRAWVYSRIVTAENTRSVEVAVVIPAEPTPTGQAVPTPTRRPRPTSVPTKIVAARCTFAGTQPRIPDPGADVQDCHAWKVAYTLVFLDRPEVAFADFDNDARVNMTYLSYSALRQAASNCNTTVDEASRMADLAGDIIEEHGNPRVPEVLLAPRYSILGGLNSVTGTYEECASVIALVLDDWLP